MFKLFEILRDKNIRYNLLMLIYPSIIVLTGISIFIFCISLIYSFIFWENYIVLYIPFYYNNSFLLDRLGLGVGIIMGIKMLWDELK